MRRSHWQGIPLTLILSLLLWSACANVERFDTAKLDETFSGSGALIPYDGQKKATYYTEPVSIVGDDQIITVYGIFGPMGTLPIPGCPGAKVSGLVGEARDGDYADITGVAGQNDAAIACNVTASGKIKIDHSRNRLYTIAEDHVIISADVTNAAGNRFHQPIVKVVFTGGVITAF